MIRTVANILSGATGNSSSAPQIRQQPLPVVRAADPMQSNPRTTEFTRQDFLQGRSTAQQIRDLYKQQPVQHRGPKIVKNEEEFEEVVGGVQLAKNDSFESTVATLGAALFAATEGRHPVVDFRQPVRLPDGHPRIHFGPVIRAQTLLGFPNEVGNLEHEDPAEAAAAINVEHSSITDALHQFVDKMKPAPEAEEEVAAQ